MSNLEDGIAKENNLHFCNGNVLKMIITIVLATCLIRCGEEKERPCGEYLLEKSLIAPCIIDMIEEGREPKYCNWMQYVYRANYNGVVTYYVRSGCCDLLNYLYDDECNVICAPNGGSYGQGDGKCTDYRDNVRQCEAIWCKDEDLCRYLIEEFVPSCVY